MQKNRNKILVSACLARVKCRYNGKDAFNEKILELMRESEIICVCPELLAGQPVPRCACNIHGGDGGSVINGTAKVIGTDGLDYTQSYLNGAKKALEIALENNVTCAYLKSNPSIHLSSPKV